MEPGPSLRADVTAQAVAAGVSAAVIGYASSVAVVVAGLTAVGATPGQVGSALVGLGLLMAAASVLLSLPRRVPVSVVWSTPGLALLVTVGPLEGGFATAVAGFAVCGVLIAATGLVPGAARALARLPAPLSAAVLAGVLLPFCLAPATAVGELPLQAGAVVLVWLLASRLAPRLAAPAALLAVVVVVAVQGSLVLPADPLPALVLVRPELSLAAVLQVALPLYVVTMAGQNLVGLAVLQANGYDPPTRSVLLGTGVASALGAPVGAPTVNLAAITGALTAGPAAHPDPSRRWVAAVSAGLAYGALALAGPLTAALVAQTDPRLVQTAAGLALVGSFAASADTALRQERYRLPAVVTLLVAASGVTGLGLGSAPLGLAAGLLVLALLPTPPAVEHPDG